MFYTSKKLNLSKSNKNGLPSIISYEDMAVISLITDFSIFSNFGLPDFLNAAIAKVQTTCNELSIL